MAFSYFFTPIARRESNKDKLSSSQYYEQYYYEQYYHQCKLGVTCYKKTTEMFYTLLLISSSKNTKTKTKKREQGNSTKEQKKKGLRVLLIRFLCVTLIRPPKTKDTPLNSPTTTPTVVHPSCPDHVPRLLTYFERKMPANVKAGALFYATKNSDLLSSVK